MKNSKKIILASVLALTSIKGIATPSIQEFETLKTIQRVEQSEKIEKKFPKNQKGEIYFKHLNLEKTINIEDMFKNKKSGVYEHPMKKNEIIVISFQDHEDLKEEHKKIKKTLLENGTYDNFSYNRHKNKEREGILAKEESSFHSITMKEEIDYNFISISSKEVNDVLNLAEETGYSKNIKPIIKKAVIFHEIAHTHNHQTRNIYEKLSNLTGKEKKYENEILELVTLGGENYSDAFMFLQIAKLQKQKGTTESKNDLIEFGDFFEKEFRKHNEELSHFDDHLTKPALNATKKFVENNWDIIEKFSSKDFEKIAASITNGTLNNPKINNKINTLEAQKKLIAKGGLKESLLEKVSNEVSEKLNEMIKINLNENGEKEISFNYKPNAHYGVNNKRLY